MNRLALVTAVALLATPGLAYASPSARLVYARSSEAASCPDEAALRRAVAARFGYDPFFPWAKRTVVVEVSRKGEQFASRVQVLDEQGVARGARELATDGPSCSELFDATALAISIALDAASNAEAATPAPPAPPPPAPEPPPMPRPGPVLAPEPADRDEVRTLPAAPPPSAWFLGVDALGSYGTAPSVSTGVAASGGRRVGAFSAALELRVDAPASRTSAGYEAGSWLYAAEIVPCFHAGPVFGCAVAALGQFVVSTRDATSPSAGTALFAAGGARLGAEVPLSDSLALRAHLDGLVDLAPPVYDVDGVPAWTAHPGTVTAGIGVVVRIP